MTDEERKEAEAVIGRVMAERREARLATEMREEARAVLAVIAVGVLLLGALLGALSIVDCLQCRATAAGVGVRHEWRGPGVCLVHLNGLWRPVDALDHEAPEEPQP